MPSQVGGWVLAIFYGIIRFFVIVGTFIWRLLTAALVTGRALLQAVYENRILAAILLILFGVGLPIQLYQEEIMTFMDQVYECGGYPFAQFTANAFPLPVTRITSETLASDWNSVGLFIWEGASDVYGDIRTLARIGKIAGVKDGLRALFGALGGRPGGGWPFGGTPGGGTQTWVEIFDLALRAVAGYFVGWYNFFLEVAFWLARVLVSWVIRLDAFNLSCSLCSLDPTASCKLREPWFPGMAAYDCDECHELTADWVGLYGSLLDAATGSFVEALSGGTSFNRIGRALGCVLRSIWMAPLQILDASAELAFEPCYTVDEIYLISDYDSMLFKWFFAGDPAYYDCDGSDSQTCCGKPSACEFPPEGGRDLPIGFLPCVGELFRALTDDEIVDWLEFLLSFVFEFIGDVILTVERSAECGDPPRDTTVYENIATISGNDVVINGSIVVFSGCNDKYTDCTPDTPDPGSVTVEVGISLNECFENFRTQSGNFTRPDPGTCGYSDIDTVPDGGIHECFNLINECLAFEVEDRAPLLEPIVESGILEFLLNTLWQFTVDFVVCPVFDLVKCFDGSTFQTLVQSFTDLDTCSPAWGSWLSWVGQFLSWVDMYIVQAIATVETGVEGVKASVAFITGVFECLDNCFEGDFSIIPGDETCSGACDDVEEVAECFGGSQSCENGDELVRKMLAARDDASYRASSPIPPEALKAWHNMLENEFGVQLNSFCGRLLGSTTPRRAARKTNYGDATMYYSCLVMYGARTRLATVCNGSDTSEAANRSATVLGIDTNANPLSDMSRIVNEVCDNDGRERVKAYTASRQLPLFASGKTHNNNNTLFDNTKVSTWWSRVADIALNITKWENLGAMGRAFDVIRTTRVYTRTAEFYNTYRTVRGSKERVRTLAPATKWRLDEMYTDYANDVLSLYHRGVFRNETIAADEDELTALSPGEYKSKVTGKVTSYLTPVRMKSVKEHAIAKMQSLHLLAPDENSTVTQQQANVQMRIDAKTWETWTVINDALHIEYSEWYQAMGGILRSLYTRDGTSLLSIVSGTHKYVTSRNEFIPATRFRKEARVSGGQKRPTLYGIITGRSEWESRKPRKYSPFFPIPAEEEEVEATTAEGGHQRQASVGTWRHHVYNRMDSVHKKYEARRSDFNETRGDANLLVYNAVDWFFGLFSIGGEGGLLNGLVQSTKDFWDQFELRDFTEESVVETLENWATCSIPENIDGTSLYSPVCLGLMREDSFAIFSGVTHDEGQFPEQLPWPRTFITKECTSHYNGLGADDVFAFEWSNNCLLPTPVSDESPACNATTCAGSLTVSAREVSPTRDVIEYVVVQHDAGADCSVASVSLLTPPCTSVQAVISDAGCVTSFDATGNASCFPVPSVHTMGVELSFPAGGSCAFRVHYADAVEFTGGDAEMFVGAECAECGVRYPALACHSADDSLVDLHRDDRPHCALPDIIQCDYCEREYAGCRANGFADVGDEFLYLTGVLPHLGDEILFGGIDAKKFELWFGPATVLAAMAANFVFLTASWSVGCCICFFPLTALAINAAHIFTWSMFIFLGDVMPYPVVFFAVAVYAQFRVPKWWELAIWALILGVSEGIEIGARVVLIVLILASRVATLKRFMKPFFIIIYIIWAIWLLSLVFTFPKLGETVSINQVFADLFFAVDNSMVLFFIDWKPLRERVDMYIYPTFDSIPDWHHFCAWWNWGNIGLLVLLFLFGMYPILLILRWIWAPILGLLSTVWAGLDMRRRIVLIFLRRQAKDAHEVAERNKRRIAALRKRASRAINKARQDIVRRIVGARGVPPMPSADQLRRGRRRRFGGDGVRTQFDWDGSSALASDDDNTTHATLDSGPDGPHVDAAVITGGGEASPPLASAVQRRRKPTRLTLDGIDPEQFFQQDD